MRSCVLAFLAILFAAAPCCAKDLQIPGDYSKVRFVTTAGKRVEALNVTIGRDNLQFTAKPTRASAKSEETGEFGQANPDQPARYTTDVAAIKYLEVQTGTKAGSYALIGGGSALLGALLGVMQVESDPNLEIKEDANVGLIVGVLTAAGVGIGALIGAASPVYTPVRRNGEWLDSVKMGAASPTAAGGLGFRLSFRF